jgi:hypothetical protein
LIISERFFKRYSVKVSFKKEDNTEFSIKAMVTHQSKAKGRNYLVNTITQEHDEEENLYIYVRTKDSYNIDKGDIVTSISIENYPDNERYVVKDKYRMVHINGKPEFYVLKVENYKKTTFGDNGIQFD